MYGFSLEAEDWNIQKCRYCNKEYTSYVKLAIHESIECRDRPGEKQSSLESF